VRPLPPRIDACPYYGDVFEGINAQAPGLGAAAITPGQEFGLNAVGFDPYSVVSVAIDAQQLVELNAHERGDIAHMVVLPVGTPVGARQVVLVGKTPSGLDVVRRLDVRVVAQPTSPRLFAEVPEGCETHGEGYEGYFESVPTLPRITEASPGGEVGVRLVGFRPNTAVVVELHSTPALLTNAVSDRNGNVTVTVSVPDSAQVGSHKIVSRGSAPSGVAIERSTPLSILQSKGQPVSALLSPITGAVVAAKAGPGLTGPVAVAEATRAGQGDTAATGEQSPTTATGGLANSGANSRSTATLGFGLLVAGLALLIPWRRFREASAE
jgi:hypothetical protein